jgi:hypothetical protein
VIIVDMAQDDEVQFASRVPNLVQLAPQVFLVDSLWTTVDEYSRWVGRWTAFQDQAVAFFSLNDAQPQHDTPFSF